MHGTDCAGVPGDGSVGRGTIREVRTCAQEFEPFDGIVGRRI